MALNTKKHEAVHNLTGSDLTAIESSFDNGEHLKIMEFAPEAALIYQMQKMQEELDYLRTEITLNKDKISLAGPSTAISFGDMITTTSLDKKGNTIITYSIVMTVVKAGVTKSTTLTLT
tara:strand:+ start:613 stop:969 length:357 start_codon:yes stop_codon:yes gene_type:complete